MRYQGILDCKPVKQGVTVYLFEDKDISSSITYKKPEIVQSYIFEGLSAELNKIFK